MNIRCPHCQTVFRVNPDRIPATGVRAKCARCGDTFMVTPPAAAPPQASRPAAPSPAPAPGPVRPAAAPPPRPPAAAAPAGPAPTARSVEPVTALHAPSPSPSAATGPVAGSGPAAPGFGARDPKAKAARLARALVSDIVAYNPERRERSLESGSLRSEFRDEIMKSWEEYVAQVGIDVAKSTPYFREALNAILAKGQKVF